LTILKHPFVYNSVSVTVDISGFIFKGNGIEVLLQGWKKSSADDDDDENSNQNFGSNIEQEKEYPVKSIETLEKKTEPKKHFTFASLLQLMENPRNQEGKRLTGLGTPATRGSILQKLVDRKYVLLKGKNILITDDGKFLIENVLKNELLASFISIPETTRWEESLHDNTFDFIENIKNFVRNAVKNTDMAVFTQTKTSLGKCPLCSSDVYEGKKNYYCGNYKGNRTEGSPPCKFVIWKEICNANISATDAEALLSGKQTKMKNCRNKTGKEFKAAFALSNGNTEFRFQ
jgi:DNA topoisomerase-3